MNHSQSRPHAMSSPYNIRSGFPEIDSKSVQNPSYVNNASYTNIRASSQHSQRSYSFAMNTYYEATALPQSLPISPRSDHKQQQYTMPKRIKQNLLKRAYTPQPRQPMPLFLARNRSEKDIDKLIAV